MSGFKIIRDGDLVFLVAPHIGHAFNMKLVSRVSIEDLGYSTEADLFVQIWSGGDKSICFQGSHAELRCIFCDTPWIKVIPPEKKP